MAELTVTPSQVYPAGTVLGAYAVAPFTGPRPPQPGQAPPVGTTPAATATVNPHGEATFSALEANTPYYVGAEVAGTWRWVTVRTAPVPEASALPSEVAALQSRIATDEAAAAANASSLGQAVAELAALEASLNLILGRPSIVNPGNQTAAVAVPTELAVQATNAASYAAEGLPAGLTISSTTGRISGTPTTAETATVKITATSSTGGVSTVSFTWTVAAANTPTVTKPGAQSTAVGEEISLQIQATNTVRYEEEGLPAGLSLNTSNGVISGTPTTEHAAVTVTIKVYSTSGSTPKAETTFTWTITAAAASGPSIRTTGTDPEASATNVTSCKAPAPREGTQTGDLLVMIALLEHATEVPTLETAALEAEGWKLQGGHGTVGDLTRWVLTATYSGQTMPTLKCAKSLKEWTVRVMSVANPNGVDAVSAWSNQAASTTTTVNGVTTTAANDLLIAIVGDNVGHSWTTPAGWATDGWSSKNAAKVFQKSQATAGATGNVSVTQSSSAESTSLMLAVKATATGGGGGETISERLVNSNKEVEAFNLPAGTAEITIARCTAESGQNENTKYENVPASHVLFTGTQERPWVACQALNEAGEPIGGYTARLKTSPELVAPTVTKPAGQASNTGTAITPLQLAATESPTSYAASGLPTGLSLNTSTGAISGTPTALGTFTCKATATNSKGTSPEVEWSWTVSSSAPTSLQTGFAMNSDTESEPSLKAVKLAEGSGTTPVIRVALSIDTAASTVAAEAKRWQERGCRMQPMATFQSRLPTEAEAKGLKAWAEACSPYGVEKIEFGNETNYQITNNKANGETYGKRAKEAAEALAGTGGMEARIKLLVQGSDAGTGQHEWLDGIFVAWPAIVSHGSFGGWTIHAYPGQHEYTGSQVDTFGIPMLERMVKRLEEQGDTTAAIYDTEWGAPSTSAGTTMTSGQSLNWEEAANLLKAHRVKLETASKGKGATVRLKQLLLYQAHDQHPEGETNREYYFGALTSSGGNKGAFTSFAKAFL